MLRVSVKGKIKGGKQDEAGKKRRRETATDSQSSVAGSTERQIMRDKLDEEGELNVTVLINSDSFAGTNLWNRTLQMSRMIKLAKEVPVDERDRSRMQLRQEAFGQWEKLFAYCESARRIISWTDGSLQADMRHTLLSRYQERIEREMSDVSGTVTSRHDADDL